MRGVVSLQGIMKWNCIERNSVKHCIVFRWTNDWIVTLFRSATVQLGYQWFYFDCSKAGTLKLGLKTIHMYKLWGRSCVSRVLLFPTCVAFKVVATISIRFQISDLQTRTMLSAIVVHLFGYVSRIFLLW